MDNLINIFYIGNINIFVTKEYYQIIIILHQNRSINTYFQKQNNIENDNNLRLSPISAQNPRFESSNINPNN